MAYLNININTMIGVVYNGSTMDRVKFGSVCNWGQPYQLTCPKLPTGVSSVTVENYSYNNNSSSGTILTQTSTTSQRTARICYYDDIKVTAVASANYSAPTVSFSSRTEVRGNMTITITPGTYNSGGGGGGGDVTFTMDGLSFSVSSGTRWCDLGTTLGYQLYDDYGLVTPKGTGGPPWIIEVGGDPVDWTGYIADGGRYQMSGT